MKRLLETCRNLLKRVIPKRLLDEKSHTGRVFIYALLAGYPAVITSIIFLWYFKIDEAIRYLGTLVILGAWIGFASYLRKYVIFTRQLIVRSLGRVRTGQYTRSPASSELETDFDEVVREITTLAETLRYQRARDADSKEFMARIMAEIDIAIFAFDPETQLQWVNRAGGKLLRRPIQKLLGETAEQLKLAALLEGQPRRTIQAEFPGGSSRWGIRRSNFRRHGVIHRLLIIEDLSLPLREEERQAWQRLVRVLGHELNNSLTPIKSIASSMNLLLERSERPTDWEQDLVHGLKIIAARTESLTRFMEAYSRLARLPEPNPRPVNVLMLLQHVATLEVRMNVKLVPGPIVNVEADPDQLEQLMINLVRNAVDASLETGGGVVVGWTLNEPFVEIWVDDEGPGLSNTSNLFTPFYTTKRNGTGIGLVLSRQIAEAHGGRLTLENKAEGKKGCIARLSLQY